MVKKVYILIINYNNWQDTIECLESVYKSNYSNFQVIVVDNDSTDHSIENIKKWSRGEMNDLQLPKTSLLYHLSFPPIKKPLPIIEYNNQYELIQGNENPNNLILIHSGKNHGFAYGNNVGLRFIESKNDYEYVFLLNNDTVIEKNTLTNLVEFQIALSKKEKVGMLGSKLLYYSTPDIIQALGGKFNKFFALASKVGENKNNNEEIISESKIDFVIGAAMLISKDFLADIGLMCEDYFIYFEEIDWATRAKKAGYSIAYCPNTKVFHKEGKTTGGVKANKSELADYFGIKNRIVFTRKFYPLLLPFVYFSFIGIILNRTRRLQFDRVGLILKILFNVKVTYENLIKKNKI